MQRSTVTITLSLLFNLFFLQCSHGQNKNNNLKEPLKLVATIPLPGVSGRIDHFAYNAKKQLIYLSALGNNTVEVVNLQNNKLIQTLKGLAEPQGILYIPESDAIFVANGDNGVCTIFNADSYQPVTTIQLKGDADNTRYDAKAKRIYVGYGSGGIAIFDGLTFKKLGDVKLPGHPESFQLDRISRKLFVNVPDVRQIDVIDLGKGAIEKTWKVTEASANFPMALDTTGQRLFIGCRYPAKLLVIDPETGKTVTALNIDHDADDIFYDAVSRRIYVSCGGGYIDVFKQIDPNQYKALSWVKTQTGARTSLFVPGLHRLFVAFPARMGHEAGIMVYEEQ